MEAQNAIVLNDLSGYLGNDPNDTPDGQTAPHEFSLPQADGGKDAWLFLAAGFVIEALVWGQFLASCVMGSKISDLLRVSVLFWCVPGILQHP